MNNGNKPHRYSDAEHDFLKAFIPGHTYKEIVEEYNKRFSDQLTVSRVKGYMGNHKINNGLTGRFKKGHTPYNKGTHPPTVGRMAETQFQKGHVPHNTKPLGYERINKEGYVEVKVRMRRSAPGKNDFFELKHRHIWETANGPIPKGHNIIFLDGNRRNCNLNNLAIISNAENLQMMRKRLRSTVPELTKTGILIAKMGVATDTAKRRRNGE